MRTYYDPGRPVFGSYFRHLTNLLRGMGASYQERTATHLDLVPESTDPVWGKMGDDELARLLGRDLPFLSWQLEHLPHLQTVVCAGATVSRWVRRQIDVDEHDRGEMERIRWWRGTARAGHRRLSIGGWNYPLDRPTGLGTSGEVELGAIFAREVR